MTDRPIIFSAPMIKALLAGAKTQTRRVIKGVEMFSPEYDRQWDTHVLPPGGSCPTQWSWWSGPPHGPSCYHMARLPYAKGGKLWVREPHAIVGDDPGFCVTRADYPACVPSGYENIPDAKDIRWRLPRYMPRAASRLTLNVTAVRVQRLQEISEADCLAEGMSWEAFKDGTAKGCDPRESFMVLWNELHGDGAWGANPWVAALTFTVRHGNIDA